jgi:hypothetical protein
MPLATGPMKQQKMAHREDARRRSGRTGGAGRRLCSLVLASGQRERNGLRRPTRQVASSSPRALHCRGSVSSYFVPDSLPGPKGPQRGRGRKVHGWNYPVQTFWNVFRQVLLKSGRLRRPRSRDRLSTACGRPARRASAPPDHRPWTAFGSISRCSSYVRASSQEPTQAESPAPAPRPTIVPTSSAAFWASTD